MYIETTEIENQVEPVLYDDNDKPLLVLPTTEDEDGQRNFTTVKLFREDIESLL